MHILFDNGTPRQLRLRLFGHVVEEAERRRELMRQVFQDFEARGVGLRMSDNLTREELYDRTRARAEAQAAATVERQDLKRG